MCGKKNQVSTGMEAALSPPQDGDLDFNNIVFIDAASDSNFDEVKK